MSACRELALRCAGECGAVWDQKSRRSGKDDFSVWMRELSPPSSSSLPKTKLAYPDVTAAPSPDDALWVTVQCSNGVPLVLQGGQWVIGKERMSLMEWVRYVLWTQRHDAPNGIDIPLRTETPEGPLVKYQVQVPGAELPRFLRLVLAPFGDMRRSYRQQRNYGGKNAPILKVGVAPRVARIRQVDGDASDASTDVPKEDAQAEQVGSSEDEAPPPPPPEATLKVGSGVRISLPVAEAAQLPQPVEDRPPAASQAPPAAPTSAKGPLVGVAAKRFEPTEPGMLCVQVGELLEILHQHHAGWSYYHNQSTNARGWAPSWLVPNVQEAQQPTTPADTTLKAEVAREARPRNAAPDDVQPEMQVAMLAATSYTAKTPAELSVDRTDVVEVLERNLCGWTYARKVQAYHGRKQEGWFPDWVLEF